jgi:hypothetical protein
MSARPAWWRGAHVRKGSDQEPLSQAKLGSLTSSPPLLKQCFGTILDGGLSAFSRKNKPGG